MKKYIIIKAQLLQALLISGLWWLESHKEQCYEEYQEAMKLKKELYQTIWDGETELLIIEKPF